MSAWRFVIRGLWHHWRINCAVALGVMAATAVLTGALIVGDSVRGSLRKLTLDRLGDIDELLISDRFFRAELADELAARDEFQTHYSSATPAIVFPTGVAEARRDDAPLQRSAGVLVLGCDERFWQLGRDVGRPKKMPGKREIVLNQPLARDLGVSLDDIGSDEVSVTVRFPKDQQIAADLSLGQKEGQSERLVNLRVVDILPAESLGRFSIHPSQSVPRNAYVALEALQSQLYQEEKANAIFVAGRADSPPDQTGSEALAAALRPTFDDYGFVLKRARLTFPEERPQERRRGRARNDEPKVGAQGTKDVIYDYYSFSTQRLLLDEASASVAERAFADLRPQPVLTYLANTIGKRPPPKDQQGNEEDIRWSMISAIDFGGGFQPRSAVSGAPIKPLGKNEIVLNQWAADDLQVEIGDTIFVTYFDPETTHGQTVPQIAEFKLADVARFTRRDGDFGPGRPPPPFVARPAQANDPDLTPFVPGLTDRESIEDWDLPFNTSNTREEDDEYYYKYFTTPKGFVSLTTGRALWSSRFGATTSYRLSAEGITTEQLEERFISVARDDEASLGFEFQPIKRRGIEASSGATPFDVLFLSLSFFIIAAALMLVSLLFRLGIDQRANEVGILLAVGLRRRLTGRMLVAEGLAVAALGGILGVAVGIAYGWLMTYGLNNWWQGAINSSFLQFEMSPRSLLIGYGSGVLVSVATIAWSIRRMRRVSARRLLSGQTAETGQLVARRARTIQIAALGLLVLAVGAAGYATQLGGEAQAGAFVGGGAALLSALLALIWSAFRSGGRVTALSGDMAFAKLAARNAGRNPTRSTITIGLVAFASFLIVAMSSFRLSPTEEGVGGFDLFAQSSQPIYANLNTPQGRDLPAPDPLQDGTVLSLRLMPGEDASCNNLYQSTRPRVLGVSNEMIRYFDAPNVQQFSFGATAAENDEEKSNPWRLLQSEAARSGEAVPVFIDKNTAMYSLKLYQGVGEEFEVAYEAGQPIKFRVAGLLSNSVLQGSLLIGEKDFEELFPGVSGYRFFLIKSGDADSQDVASALEEKFDVQGFDATSSREELSGLLAVQNTYLSTFQSLGALGLLLGTFGLATVQLRSVLERRQELALMRAAGFRRARLAQMVMLENAVLLLGGLATGILAALLAVLPHMFFGDATIPWDELAVMLGVIFVTGLLTGFAAVLATLRAPLLSALRGE